MCKGYGEESVNERLIRLEEEENRLTIEIKQLNINKKNKERNNKIGDQVISK